MEHSSSGDNVPIIIPYSDELDGSQSNQLEQSSNIRENLHDIKLKDAILRQEIRKAERSQQDLQQQIEEGKKQIDGLQRQLKKDKGLLKQQENAISTAKITPIYGKISENSFNSLQALLDKKRNWFFSMKSRHEEELELYRKSDFCATSIKSVIRNPEKQSKTLEYLQDLISAYEQHIQLKESILRDEETGNNQDLAAFNKHKQKLERTADHVREKRIKDQRRIFQLNSRIGSLQSENTLTIKSSGDKTEEEAIGVAETILGKLQQKLKKHKEMAPLVDKLASSVSKSKKRVIYLDLAKEQ